jgi:hypothetical protein
MKRRQIALTLTPVAKTARYIFTFDIGALCVEETESQNIQNPSSLSVRYENGSSK